MTQQDPDQLPTEDDDEDTGLPPDDSDFDNYAAELKAASIALAEERRA